MASAAISMDMAHYEGTDAFERLVLPHEKSLSNYLRRFTSNETILQDLRQETYLEVFRSLPNYRCEGAFSAWLRRIAARVGYRYWAGQNKELRAKAAYLELRRSHPSPQDIESAEFVNNLLALAGPCDRMVLELRYVQGFTDAEIATQMGWNAGCVRVRLHRARKRLRNRHDNGAT